MYSRFFLLVLLGVNLVSPSLVLAQQNEELLSAGELLVGCEEGALPGSPNQYCMRYVFGLVQTVTTLQQAEQSPPIFCIDPQQVRLEVVTDQVIAYLRLNTQRKHEEAQTLVLEALNKNYSCSSLNILDSPA